MSTFTVSGRIEADAKGLVQAAREGSAALEQLAAAEQQASTAASQMSTAVSAAMDALARGDQAALSLANAQINLAASAAGAAASEQAHARELKGAQQAAREAEAAMEALARGERLSAVAANANAKAQRDAAVATGLNAHQARQLAYTFSDVVASLGSGISPMTILMQQGPQVAQAFDSPRDAITKLLGTLGPLRLGLLGAAAAAGIGIAAHESYAASVRAVTLELAVHGDRIGITSAGYLQLASDIAATARVSERDGRTIAGALIASGAASAEVFTTLATAARGYAVATRQDAGEAALELAEKLKLPGRSARELASEYNMLDDAQVRQIESMERSGDLLGAQRRLAEALNGKFEPLIDQTSGWARAWEWLGRAASNAWDSIGRGLFGSGVPGADPVAEIDARIAAAETQVRAARNQINGGLGPQQYLGGTPMALDQAAQLEKELAVMKAQRVELAAIAEAKRKAEEKARESLAIGQIADRYNPEQTALDRLKDEETRARAYLARDDLDAGQRKRGESALNAILQERESINERLAKQGVTDGDREAKRLTERLALQRQDLDLLQQIVVARAKGDDDAARRLQGQREAARRGFDLSTPDGAASAELGARSDQLASALKAMDDIEARMARLNPKVTAGANAEALAADLRAAMRWKAETIAAFEGTGEAAAAYGAKVETIFNDMVASAYEEDLRRRTDWAAGVQRAFIDLKRESEDFASVAERGIKDASATIKDELISAARSGEASFDRLADAFERMILEMAYQKYLASQVEGAVGWAVDLIGGLFGISGAGGNGLSGGAIGAMGGKRHGGGIGNEPFTSVFSLPKHHDGWMGSRSTTGEHLAVIRNDEGVFTPRQMENADRLIEAVASRPIVVSLTDYSGGRESASEAKIMVNLYGAPAGTQVEQRRDQNGDMTIDVIMDQMEDRMAMRIGQGRSPINTAIEQVYAGQRQVA